MLRAHLLKLYIVYLSERALQCKGIFRYYIIVLFVQSSETKRQPWYGGAV